MLNRIMMAVLAITCFGLVGCADEYATVKGPGYFVAANKPFTGRSALFQDHVTSKICDVFVKETTPGRWVTIGARAFNHGVGGAIGGPATALSQQVEASDLGEHLIHVAPGALSASGAIFYGLTGAVEGGISGNENYNARKFGNTQVCLKSAAGGLWSIAPSLAQAVKDGTVSKYKLADLLVENNLVTRDKDTGKINGLQFPEEGNWGGSVTPAAKTN